MRLFWPVPLLALAASCSHAPPAGQPIPAAAAKGAAALRPLVHEVARRHGVPPALVMAVIQVESGFCTTCQSSAGARGLMQLMPRTATMLARRLGRPQHDIEDPAFNIEAGTAFLASLLDLFAGEVPWALAAYHSGPARVMRWRREGRPLPAYSRRYVAAVLDARERFTSRGPVEADGPGSHSAPDSNALRSLIRERRAIYDNRHR